MQSCLGVYIEENLIKYAKVQKDKDNIKIEAFGTKFYDNLEQSIEQIVAETNSTKIPISINVSEEYYDYFQIFALLDKKSTKNSIEIEFEMLCQEKGINKDLIEKRYIFVLDQEDPDKMKAINVSVEKEKIERKKELFGKYNLTSIQPLPLSLINLIKPATDQNELIVNMEENTTLTFLENGQVEKVDLLETSISEALNKITKTENSKTKAYEILKNITISSQDMESIQEGNEYLDVVVPVLFKMLNEMKEKMAEFGKQIHKIYFTGTGIVINNVDMYFQDRLNDIQCEIIKPGFIDSQSLKIGIKDYIEVNSAISMALNGLGVGTTNDLNFAGKSGGIAITGIELPNISMGKAPKVKSLKESSQDKLDAFEKLAIRISVLCIIFVMCYSALTSRLFKNMEEKIKLTNEKITETTTSVASMSKSRSSIEFLKSEYESIIARLNNQSVVEGESVFREKEIPNFLTQLTTTIPTEVKLVSLENTAKRHIVIQARAIKYQQLGYFQAILKANNILTNVSASTGIRYHDDKENEDYILVTIEGDLV